jgi:hypothetical protein
MNLVELPAPAVERAREWRELLSLLGSPKLVFRDAGAPPVIADLLIHGGPILTMVGDRPQTVAAVVVEGGRIAFAGPLAQAQRIAGAETQRLDLKGRTLLPGLVDAHSHLAMAVDLARRVNVSGAPVGTVASIADLVRKLADGAAALKIAPNEWLVGWGYDASQLADKRDLTRRDLQNGFKAKGQPWDAAKGFDASAPISAIRPFDGTIPQGAITLSVNGEVRQQAQVADMIWSVEEILVEAGKLWTLEPGDLIYTGTPEGVAALQRGDTVTGAVEGVGTLTFKVV